MRLSGNYADFGAEGVKTILLLGYENDCEWRWGTDPVNNGFYKSVEIIRAKSYSNWENIIDSIDIKTKIKF